MRQGMVILFTLLGMLTFGIVNCTSPSSLQQDGIPFSLITEGGNQQPLSSEPTTPVVDPVKPVPGDLHCDIWDEDGIYYLRCENGLLYPAEIHAVCYIIKSGGQDIFDYDSKIIEPGNRGTAVQPLPTCDDIECGEILRVQCDGYADHEPPKHYNFPDRHPGFITGSGKVYNLGPCPECQECIPVGKPYCSEQTWNEVTCSWEGPCPCEPIEEQCFQHTGASNPTIECGWIGMVPLGKVENPVSGECVPAHMDAGAAIVKGGTWYHVIPNVTVGQSLCSCDAPIPLGGPGPMCPAWSHATYCGCPQE